MPPLLLVSALTAAYGAWLFDLVILLVPVLAVAARLSRPAPKGLRLAAAAAYAVVGGAALALMLVPHEVQYLHYIWITPAVLAGYVVLTWRLGGAQARSASEGTPPQARSASEGTG